MKISLTCYNNKSLIKKQTNNNNTKSSVPFKAKAWKLPNVEINNSYDAMTMYNYLKVGNYLDSSDDDVSFDSRRIRENNFSFLDKLKTPEEKKEFIEYYKEVTGFPDLEKVSKNIEREFILGIKKSSIGINGGKCIAAGYDETCSVGKKRAFPGSDLDKSFIILQGSPDGNTYKDIEIVNNFKANLWNNVDQRILSFNHDISFPSVYTVKQIKDTLSQIDNRLSSMPIEKERFQKVMKEEYKNLEVAAEYNIGVAKYFPMHKNPFGLNKEEVKNFGYFLESVRDGKYLINDYPMNGLKQSLKNSKFYQYSNVAQIQAMKSAVKDNRENKTKIIIREDLPQKFETWSVDKQYEFIKTLIKYTCEDHDNFLEYFTNDRDAKKAYKPLLNQLTCGDRNVYNRPEFKKIDNGLEMKYADEKSVNLYKGFNSKILWVDSNDSTALNQVIRNIDKIKQCELFENVHKIQCTRPSEYIDGFNFTSYTTKNNEVIYEKDLRK